MPVTTARQRILAQIAKLGSASARDLARTLRMSEATVRHHLRHLAADGRVISLSSPQQGGSKNRGRPENIFRLSAALEGDNLAGLVEALFNVQRSTLNAERLAEVILDTNPFSNLPIPKRLALIVQKLNEMHYQARWEAGAEGPRILLGRCPYTAVIEKHPELCRMDAALLASALGTEVRQLAKIEKLQGLCVFAMK